jgi:hypothetical protein
MIAVGVELSARLRDLLVAAPEGIYLVEQLVTGIRLLRLSEGEPGEDALEPATMMVCE